MNLKKLIILACGIILTGCTSVEKVKYNTPKDKNYVFTYFKGNGKTGLHMVYSHDGLNWKKLKNGRSFLRPKLGDKIMRDPCVIKGPDGIFHMVWTLSWYDKKIGIAHSKDLINWSEQKEIPVMAHEAKARNCWAPEIFYDDINKQYLIFWATTIPGRFPETDKQGDNGLKSPYVLYSD